MGILELRRDVKDFRRLQQIIAIVIEHGFQRHMSVANLSQHAPLRSHFHRLFTPHQETTPERVRELFEALGPTFVKLGQVLSLRPDLVPKEYCDEFKKLQDGVAPIPFSAVKAVVEEELHRPLLKVFKEFSEIPIASASIGQVHKATLQDGTVVVVKVQRPGVREVMASDIDIMEYLARRIDKSRYKFLRASAIVSEFKTYTQRELDLTFEMRTLKKFYAYFTKNPNIIIPNVYEELTTSRVLVLEYIDGIPLTDKERLQKAGYSLPKLAKVCMDGLLYQAFDLGIFHADPHPGNLLAVRKGKKQMLAFIDFGIVGFLDEDMKEAILEFFNALVQSDAHAIATIAVRIGQKGPNCNPAQLEEAIARRLMEWKGTSVREERITTLFANIMRDIVNNDVRVPASITLLAKAFVTIEGTGTWLDPDINLTDEFGPQLRKLALRKYSPASIKRGISRQTQQLEELARELPTLAEAIADKIKAGKVELHVDTRELLEAESVYDLETGKRNLSVIMGAFFIGSVFAWFAPQSQMLGVQLYWWGTAGFVVTFLFYLRLSSKIHKYLRSVE